MKSCNTQRPWLLRHNFRKLFARIVPAMRLRKSVRSFSQKIQELVQKAGRLLSLTYYSTRHDLAGGDMDGSLHEDASLRAVNANWNVDNGYWNVNANSVENPNEWNADNRVFSRNYCISPVYLAGVFICRPRFQPPSIRSISSSVNNNSEYFPVATSLSSHAS